MSINSLQAVILWFIAGLLLVMILAEYLRYKVHLLSIRNMMLLGFIIYQLISPAATLYANDTVLFRISDLVPAGWRFIMLLVLFLSTFLIAYRSGWMAKSLARKIPVYKKELSEHSLILSAVIATILSAIARVPAGLPAIAFAAFFISLGMATASTGLATLWWMRQALNPARLAVSIFLIGTNLLILLSGQFGRRPIVAVMLMLAWAIYYARFRHVRRRLGIIITLIVASTPMLIFAALFTSARFQGIENMSSTEVVEYVWQEGDISEGLNDLLGGQLVGEASLWCVEAFPQHLPQDHLMSLRYYFVSNIPRTFWPEKPYVLSARLADLADVRGVNQDRARGGTGVTLPPGVVGYAAAEGGYYAALIYGLVLGIIARFLDELATIHSGRIIFIIPIAASLGNVVGLLRGDISQFAIAITWSILASFGFILLLSSMFGRPTQTQLSSQTGGHQ